VLGDLSSLGARAAQVAHLILIVLVDCTDGQNKLRDNVALSKHFVIGPLFCISQPFQRNGFGILFWP
jgi:hypothetical protein